MRDAAPFRRFVDRVQGTLVAAVIAGALLSGSHWLEASLKAMPGAMTIEIVSGVIFVAGVAMDLARARQRMRRKSELEEAKLRALRLTMRTVQHIVNTFLTDLVLLEMEAANVLPQPKLDRLDAGIQEIAKKLKALGDVTEVRETPLGAGFGVEFTESED